jgi:hypothetical protein
VKKLKCVYGNYDVADHDLHEHLTNASRAPPNLWLATEQQALQHVYDEELQLIRKLDDAEATTKMRVLRPSRRPSTRFRTSFTLARGRSCWRSPPKYSFPEINRYIRKRSKIDGDSQSVNDLEDLASLHSLHGGSGHH